jgi:hypothetical protein
LDIINIETSAEAMLAKKNVIKKIILTNMFGTPSAKTDLIKLEETTALVAIMTVPRIPPHKPPTPRITAL